MVRKTSGRQKVEMVRMKKESNLQVTFSKRRSGLFKKACELCTLCGAEIAIIVFSPGKKAFSFGHPCVETVVDRYLARDTTPQPSPTTQLLEAHRNASVRELNVQVTQVLHQLEMEKNKGEELDQMRKASQARCWWESPVEDLCLPQLEQLKESLVELKKNVAKQADKLLIQQSNSRQYFGSSSSTGGVHHYDQKNVVFSDFNPNMKPHGPGPHGYNPGYGHGFY